MPDPIASSNHGAVTAVLKAIRLIGLANVISAKRCPERDLVLAMIAARIITHGQSKAALARSWQTTTLASELGIGEASAVALYRAMDWLEGRQNRIQNKLARKYLKASSLVMYDLTFTWMEGHHCPLARTGYSWDGKRGKLQVNCGLLCDIRGRPVAVSVHAGNVADPQTIGPEIDRLRKHFSLARVVAVTNGLKLYHFFPGMILGRMGSRVRASPHPGNNLSCLKKLTIQQEDYYMLALENSMDFHH